MEHHEEHQPRNQRRVPRVPEPIDYDPFEMDWPWPGMMDAEDPPVEPSRSELPGNAQPSESATPAPADRD